MQTTTRIVVILLIFFLSTPALAAISILEPNGQGNERVAEGVEFSAYVIGNRWDMSDAGDVVTSESGSLVNQQFSGGIFSATTTEVNGVVDPAFFLTFHGVAGSVLSLDRGQMFPIDTSVYRHLTMKIRHLRPDGSPANVDQPVIVYFFRDENSYPQSTFGFTEYVHVPSDGNWHIVQFDLVNDISPVSQYWWTDFSTVKGLRIDPTNYDNIRVEVDWVRLTAEGTPANQFQVQWSGGTGPFDVVAKLPGNVAFPLAKGVDGGSANVDLSKIPSGDYLIEVASSQETRTSSHPIHVNQSPIFHFTQPDIEGDVANRYSLIETGNPWGPMDAADVSATSGLTGISYTNPGGSLTATSTGGDSSILFRTAGPIDTDKYRMLSYTLSVSGSRDIGQGSVARILWGSNMNTLNNGDDIIVQEGLNRYRLGDLKDLPVEGGATGLWSGSPFYFRLDPHEFSSSRMIRLDDLTLAPFDSANPSFEIGWVDSDVDDNASISLFADRDKIPGNANEFLIASGIAEDSATNSLLWNAQNNVPGGLYHLYATINDGLNQTTRYATGPLLVGDGTSISLSVAQPDGQDDSVLAADEFSRLVENNLWDMADSGDVPFARSNNINNETVSGGILSGTSSGNDPAFYLLYPGATNNHTGSNGVATPIDTTKYRYLTFKARFTANGPVSLQVYFMRDGTILPGQVGYTDFLEIFPGQWKVYTIDLESASSSSSPYSWSDLPSMQGLRIDPATGPGIAWEFDWFTLTGPSNGTSQYPVTWNVSDPGSSTVSLSAIDEDGFRIPLAEGIAPQAGFATVDLGRLPVRSYQIEARAVPGPSTLSPGAIDVLTSGTAGEVFNISTRAQVGTGHDVTIAGFIIQGSGPKQVLIRGGGPTVNVASPRLANPRLRLFNSAGAYLTGNDDWTASESYPAISTSSLALGDPREAAILATLLPGAYTAILDSPDGGTGIGIIEVFNWDQGVSHLWNISTRARVGTGDNIAIAGFILRGPGNRDILIRAVGPSLPPDALPANALRLGDPRLKLFNQQGVNILTNDNWQSAANASEINATGMAPGDARESAILANLPPGNYTVFLEGADGGSGIGIIEVFDRTTN